MQSVPEGLAGNIIEGKALTGIIENFLREELCFEQARGAANAVVKQLRERNFILCFIGGDSYAFVHRTFLEYFCAADIVHKFNHQRALNIEDLLSIFDEHYTDDAWREVLRLICGQIDEQFVGQIVEHLTNKVNVEGWSKKSDLAEIPLAMLCVGESKKSEKLRQVSYILMSKIEKIFTDTERFNIRKHKCLVGTLQAAQEIGKNWPVSSLNVELPSFSSESFFSDDWIVMLQSLGISKNTLISYSKSSLPGVRAGSMAALGSFFDQDNTMYEFFVNFARVDSSDRVRLAALRQVINHWHDQATHKLLSQLAMTDKNENIRLVALMGLADHWRDQVTRVLVRQCLLNDEDENVRQAALIQLTEYWRDEATRELLINTLNDKSKWVIRLAVQRLTEYWHDQATHGLLLKLLNNKTKWTDTIILEMLAKYWHDQATRELLEHYAVSDVHEDVRQTAVKQLAEYWHDQATREFLQQRILSDKHEDVRQAVLEQLSEYWHDQATRELLEHYVVNDVHEDVRQTAVQQLAEYWHDQATREFLQQRILSDRHEDVRQVVLEQLSEYWHDQATRELLEHYAVNDVHEDVRQTAVQQLAEYWHDQAVFGLLLNLVLKDSGELVRRTALELLNDNWGVGQIEDLFKSQVHRNGFAAFRKARAHSNFGKLVLTRDADGFMPYLNPEQPISDDRILKAAIEAEIPETEIPAMVESLSKHMGWDITKGSSHRL